MPTATSPDQNNRNLNPPRGRRSRPGGIRDGSPQPEFVALAKPEGQAEATQRTLWLIGVLDTVLIVGGLLSTGTYVIDGHQYTLHLAGLAASLAIIAIITFLGFYWFYRELRDAIAAAVILTYITLLASMFNSNVQDALNHTSLGSGTLASLTTLTATVAGFYFIGRSYERASEVRAAAAKTEQSNRRLSASGEPTQG
jgi:hypothetical protein